MDFHDKLNLLFDRDHFISQVIINKLLSAIKNSGISTGFLNGNAAL
jgi:hypothetical protein